MFARYDDSFEDLYKEVAETNINFCVKLLDEVQCEDEGGILMRYTATSEDAVNEHEFIHLAVKFHQKQVLE